MLVKNNSGQCALQDEFQTNCYQYYLRMSASNKVALSIITWTLFRIEVESVASLPCATAILHGTKQLDNEKSAERSKAKFTRSDRSAGGTNTECGDIWTQWAHSLL